MQNPIINDLNELDSLENFNTNGSSACLSSKDTDSTRASEPINNTLLLINFILSTTIDIDKDKLNEIKQTLKMASEKMDLTAEAENACITQALQDIKSALNNHENEIMFKILNTLYKEEHEEMCLMLLQVPGMDLNSRNGSNPPWTPLEFASCNGKKKIVAYLLDHGAEINIKGRFGTCALYRAVEQGHTDCVELLLNNGGNANSGNTYYGSSVLINAAEDGNKEIVALLLKYGADPNHTDKKGYSALMYTTTDKTSYGKPLTNEQRKRKIEIAELLLKHGADPNLKNMYGRSTLMDAARDSLEEIVNLLLENGAEVNDKDYIVGRPVLNWAVYGGNRKITKKLIDHGANVFYKGSDGRNGFFQRTTEYTALKLATDMSATKTISMLMKVHMQYFYEKAMINTQSNLLNLKEEQRSMGAVISANMMCDHILELAELEPTLENSISLLRNALKDHAFGAFMKQLDNLSEISSDTSSSVTKIANAIKQYQSKRHVSGESLFIMQYQGSDNIELKEMKSNHTAPIV